MGLRIQHNIAAMNAHRMLSISDAGLAKSLERLSSGYRINRAADDAAGLAISQGFRADIASFGVASRNTSEAASLLQVGEGAMDQIGNMLTRLKELATQAASANAGANLDKLEAEKEELVEEIDRIANVTEYAGSKLIDGTFGTYSAAWGNELVDTTYDLDTVNGNKYLYTDTGTNTATVSFTFASDVADLVAQTYTLATMGATLSSGVSATGGTNSVVYVGTYNATAKTLSFSDIGLTVTGESALTTTSLAGDTFAVSDIGYSSMSVSNTTPTGTWSVTSATANSITLTNSRTSDAQTVTTVDGSAQTVDFDQLGIKLTLNSGYADDEFDTLKFVVSSSGASTFQVGAGNTANDRVDISLGDATASGLSIDALDYTTAAGAQSALDTIDSAISTLVGVRGGVGAAQNRLSYAAANLATTIENIQAAESVIRDVDMAAEMTAFTKNQILLQAGTAMLAQANMAPQVVLQLMG
ncbi:MAG: hypothetical protein HWN69_02350 [Desulfobacterales bacterium]|nr:hypothetical protein [Desulfobacterales bacterium]